MKFSLSKKNKLKSSKQISEVFFNKKNIKYNSINLFYKKIDSNEEYKVAFFIPKKYIKSAVDRKKIKRLMSENFRLEIPHIKNNEINHHLIFIYQNSEMKSFTEIKIIIKYLLNKLYNN